MIHDAWYLLAALLWRCAALTDRWPRVAAWLTQRAVNVEERAEPGSYRGLP